MVQSSSMTYDKRGTHEGYIRGEIYFVDASVLGMVIHESTRCYRLTHLPA